MNTTFQLVSKPAFLAAESLGKVKRTTAALPVLRTEAPRTELQAVTLRALAANGFGEAAIDRTEAYAPLCSPELHAASRADRSQRLLQMIVPWLQSLCARLHELAARRRQRALARATYLALRELDAHTLRDIGLHGSEILSVVAEACGSAEATRIRLVPAPRVPR